MTQINIYLAKREEGISRRYCDSLELTLETFSLSLFFFS